LADGDGMRNTLNNKNSDEGRVLHGRKYGQILGEFY